MSLKRLFQTADEPTRRDFLALTARNLLTVSAVPYLGRVAFAQDPTLPLQAATARNVIYLYMNGGMSHLDTFDLKPGAETQGPTEAIRTRGDGVRISNLMPNLAGQMDKVAVINSMQSTQGAHDQGRYFMHTSYELRGTIQHPSLGAWLNRMAGPTNPTLPGHVEIGGTRYTASGGFFPSNYAPLPIGDPNSGLQNSGRAKGVDAETFDRRLERVRKMNAAFHEEYEYDKVKAYSEMYEQAVRLMSSRDLAAFDLNHEADNVRDAYGRNRFGQGCLLARRLIEHSVRFVEVVLGGWDTHVENFDSMEENCPVLDQALSALLADLEARGLLEETLVVVATEFGRTPVINGNNGRDHYPKAFSCLLAGGGIVGGRNYGATDPTGQEVIEDGVTVADFNATIAYALGLPLEHQLFAANGRPFTVADKGQPVKALFV